MGVKWGVNPNLCQTWRYDSISLSDKPCYEITIIGLLDERITGI